MPELVLFLHVPCHSRPCAPMIVLKLSAEESLIRKVAGRQPQRLRELLQRKYPFPSAYSRLKSVQNALCHQTTSNFQNTQTPQNILPFPSLCLSSAASVTHLPTNCTHLFCHLLHTPFHLHLPPPPMLQACSL